MSNARDRTRYGHSAVMARLAQAAGVTSDAALAAVLGVSPPSFASWKMRGSVPYERICQFALERNVSLDWLFLGMGSPRAPIGNPINNEVFGEVFRALYNHLYRVAGADEMDWTYLVSSATAIYNDALAIAANASAGDVESLIEIETRAKAAALAHAKSSVLRQHKATDKPELERLEKVADELGDEIEQFKAKRRDVAQRVVKIKSRTQRQKY